MSYVRFGLLTLLLVAACKNFVPSSPAVFGPSRCRMNDTVSFTAMSVDVDGDSVSYYFEWSGGPVSGWTDWFVEGSTAYVPAWFADSGDYWVRVKARDLKETESGWADTSFISVRDWGPYVPRRPSGPDTAVIYDSVVFISSGRHPLAERIALQFRWDDSLGAWSGFVWPDSLVRMRHTFGSGGRHEVRCRAKDKGERLSDWSAPESVWVIDTFRFR